MNGYDITAGGIRRILDANQAANLHEIQRRHDELEQFLAQNGPICTARWDDVADRLHRDEAMWDQLGEDTQDPGNVESA
ncbi:MAG: hypothetical protein L0G94_07155 [Brachybacterium sp.]|uniref:hypothetical protein n=1 Tax=Brachybacterium sp. TaxID=1891286 RepID=UPI002647CD9F|nr:hypothetical protein [Brachybacterium sp.]MDN5686448.1 hypothetical protein [Brachybacterium sp.]